MDYKMFCIAHVCVLLAAHQLDAIDLCPREQG